MNGEEEGILEVMQELHPPSLIEDQSPEETTRDPEQVEECQSLNALNEPEAERELAPDENVEGREGDCEVGDSSLPGEGNFEMFGAAEISVVKDELVLETEGKGEDDVLPAVAVEEDGLIGGIEDLDVAEKDGGVRDEITFPAGDEGGELMGEGVAMVDEEQGVGEESVEVKGASPEGDTDNEGNVQADVEIEKLQDEQKAPEVQLSCSSGKEEGKLDGDGESQRDIEQDCESKFGEVTAQVDEKMDENREMEEAGAHTDGYLLPLALSDGDMIKEGNTEALDAEIKEWEDSKIDLEEVKRELKEEEEEKQMEVGEDMGIKEEDEEMEGGEAKEVDKETEEEEEIEVKANKEKEIEGGERHADSKKDGVMPVAEKEPEKGEETEVEANKKKAMEDEERQVDAQENEEMQRGEDKEVGKETEVEKEMEDKAGAKEVEEMLVGGGKEVEKETDEEEPNKGKILEDEKRHVDAHEDVEMQGGEAKEVEKVTEIEANKENEMEDEDVEMQGGEAKEVKKVIEIEANEENEMEDEERQAITKEDEEMEGEEERKVEGKAEEETEDEEEREVDADEEKEMEDAVREHSPKSGSGKRKRGRNSEAVGKASSKKKLREDVCFICLDGGDLVFCDRRGCHKGYHPSCAELDEAFFQSKGRWNCGWHSCNQCKKAACFMCYTCQFALCKGCAKSDAVFICVRGNKGLCETCMRSVMLIESNEGNAGTDESTVDDKSRKNYLFKDYWAEQKEMLSLTLDEIAQAKSHWMQEMPTEILAGNVNGGIVTDKYLGSAETTDSKRTKPKKRMRSSKDVEYDADYSSGKAEASGAKKKGKKGLKSLSKEDYDSDNSSKDNVGSFTRGRKAKKLSKAHAFEVDSASHGGLISEDISSQSGTEWASKELLEFVVHMKDGNRAPLSQYDVQELLLEYIQRNKLRDPRRKSQIVCDAMLQKLFGKPRVGHFEMLKLLELHFLIREDSQADDNQGSVVDAEGSQLDADENADSLVDLGKYRGKKARRKGDGRLQSNLDDYAAIDMHNITLIYLRRNLIEALLEDSEGFHEKVVGSFVRIRIPGSNQKHDIYRLVQVIGTNKAEPYKVGKRIAYCMLEILNLNKTEVVSIDTISNQDFSEDECKRLRQSIKCGLISRLTVGDVMDKAKDLQAVRVTDWLETEITRLNHLRDRASDLGRKKEECVEKLQLLSTPEERQRRLDEIPEVHADPNMDPIHESEDETEPEEKEQEINVRPRETSFQWRERDHFPSRKGESASTDPWSPTERTATRKWDSSRSLSGKGFSSRLEDTSAPEEAFHGSPWSPVRDKLSSHSTSSETFRTDSSRRKIGQYPEMRNDSSASAPSDASQPFSASLVQNPVKFSDSEKLWHYKDPTGKDQGPFSVVQLRKWNKSGYFPATLHIWRTGQSEDDAIFLTEALAGRFEKLPSQILRKPIDSPANQTYRGQSLNMLKVDRNRGVGSSTRDTFDQMSPVMQRSRSDTSSKGWTPLSVDTSKFSHNDSPNLSSTPPSQRTSSGWSGRPKVSRWSGSPTPIHLPSSASGSPAANGMLPSPTPESSRVLGSSNSPLYEHNRSFNRSHLAQQSTRDSINVPSRSREDERYAQQPPPQSIVPHQTQQQVTETTTANNTIQAVSGQNLAVSSHGWGTGSYMPNPETTSNLNTNNGVQLQGQQTVYSQWTNTPANNLPPPPPQPTYGNSGTFPVQNPSAALPSQAPWTPQVAATQPNMQWTGMPTTQYPGNNPGATWAPPVQQANPTNIGWGPPAGQYGSQPGPVAPANVIQTTGQTPGMQPGNMNMTWQPAGNMNPGGWAPLPANPGGPGPWNWKQQQQQPPPNGGAGMGPPGRPMRRKSDMPCPFFMQGHCKKGANCDYRHN